MDWAVMQCRVEVRTSEILFTPFFIYFPSFSFLISRFTMTTPYTQAITQTHTHIHAAAVWTCTLLLFPASAVLDHGYTASLWISPPRPLSIRRQKLNVF